MCVVAERVRSLVLLARLQTVLVREEKKYGGDLTHPILGSVSGNAINDGCPGDVGNTTPSF